MSHSSDELASFNSLDHHALDHRGRDWRRSQRENHPDRRRRRGDTEITRVSRDRRNCPPKRLRVEADRLACLLTEGEA